MTQHSLGYYDIISGLSALECSHRTCLSPEQLQAFCRIDQQAKKTRDQTIDEQDESHRRERRRIPVHGYLSKADAGLKLENGNDLQHTLLGGHVPRSQLEALSSTDFARYFQKLIDFEKTTEAFNVFVNSTATRAANVAATPTPPSSALPSGQAGALAGNDDAGLAAKPKLTTSGNDSVKKVILCKKCKARFSGPRRFTNMNKHMCMRS
ncbi:LAFA_0D10616g1_1 [Lachancea sp. 'fantastica']|nr:LAFA_0D10616g1_1 [Lachancea sp. 'fantastica']